MKYFIRAVKYFIYFSLLCTLIIAALVLIGAVEGSVDSIFSEGYVSIAKIAAFFAIIAAMYPKVGFITRDIAMDRDWAGMRDEVIGMMNERGFILETESEQAVTFRYRNTFGRIAKMYEDRLTLTITGEGYRLEGLRKDVIRIAAGIEHLGSLRQG